MTHSPLFLLDFRLLPVSPSKGTRAPLAARSTNTAPLVPRRDLKDVKKEKIHHSRDVNLKMKAAVSDSSSQVFYFTLFHTMLTHFGQITKDCHKWRFPIKNFLTL